MPIEASPLVERQITANLGYHVPNDIVNEPYATVLFLSSYFWPNDSTIRISPTLSAGLDESERKQKQSQCEDHVGATSADVDISKNGIVTASVHKWLMPIGSG